MKAIKVKIYPNKTQQILIEKHFGCCRFIYNWSLDKKIKYYQQNKKSLSSFNIMKELTQLKKQKEYGWLNEIHSQSLQQTIRDLDSAFSHFFRHNKKFPKFKSKKCPKQSYRLPQGFKVNREKHHLFIPKLEWVRFKDKFNIDNDVEFRNITISKHNNNYFVSICYKENKTIPNKSKIEKDKILGIDLGIKAFATFSNETKIENPKFVKKYEDKLTQSQQKLSNKKTESKNYQKQKQIINKIYGKITNSRKDFLHKLSNSIIENQNYTSYAMEDLSVKEMQISNYSPVSRAIGDVAWRTFRNIMSYKCDDVGKNLILIGKFDASSKTCSCGEINHNLELDDREWICDKCNTKHDRDILAANNIKTFAFRKFQEVGQSSTIKS